MQKRIVVVEDEKHLTTGLSLNLRSAGYKEVLLHNAEDAYEKITVKRKKGYHGGRPRTKHTSP